MVIGAVLSSMIELNFRRSLQLHAATDTNIVLFFLKRPASVTILVIVISIFLFFSIKRMINDRRIRKQGNAS